MTAPRLGIVVASTRGAGGIRQDTTGPLIAEWGRKRGLHVLEPRLVTDGEPVETAMRELIDSGCAVVITTGGTGLGPDDVTPEITARVIDRDIPGIAEEIRRRGLANTPHAALSRGIAGIAGATVVVNLAGSPGAVHDGLAILDELLEHILAQTGHTPNDEVHT